MTNLDWIEHFFDSVKEHIFLRDEDAILILPPNRVFKLNETGLNILRHLYSGKEILSFPGLAPGDRARDINRFFSNLKAAYENRLSNPDAAPAVDRTPYTFDFTALPILGEIALTYRCNNRCEFCYAGCGGSNIGVSEGELGTRKLKAIIRIFREEAKIPFFSFTGGEPLLRNDLESLIAYAAKLKLKTNLVSNGILATPERVERLVKSGLKTAQISIESRDPDIHDALTGISGSWRRTVTGIENLLSAGVSVQTNTTLNAKNVGDIRTLPSFLSKLGVRRFAMNLFIPPAHAGACVDESLFYPYSQTGPVVEKIRREAAAEELTFFWYSPIPHCLYNPIARGLGNKSCAAMDGLLSVAPNGDVLPCSSYPESLGNLLQKPFKEIWFSERALYFKKKRYAPSECEGCDKFIACQGACPLYWRYAGTEELRHRANRLPHCRRVEACR